MSLYLGFISISPVFNKQASRVLDEEQMLTHMLSQTFIWYF